MELKFYSQPNTTTNEIIGNLIENNKNISMAVAYLSSGGLKEVERNISYSKDVRILCGVHGCISDLFALKGIVDKSNFNIQGHVFIGTELFHPKIYIFSDDKEASIVVGSPNLTAGGLKNNEESFVLVKGLITEPEIKPALLYFEELWCKRSISVDYYLSQHPDYSKKDLPKNELTNSQLQILKKLEPLIQKDNILKFEKIVKKEILNNGRVTIPKKFDQNLNRIKYCPKGESREIVIILPNGKKLPGKFYQSINNSTSYYQFYIKGQSGKEYFKNFIDQTTTLMFEFNLLNHNVHIYT